MLGIFSTGNCLFCNSSQLRRARRHVIERILLPFAVACRCNECGYRFYTIGSVFRRHARSNRPVEISGIRKSGTASMH